MQQPCIPHYCRTRKIAVLWINLCINPFYWRVKCEKRPLPSPSSGIKLAEVEKASALVKWANSIQSVCRSKEAIWNRYRSLPSPSRTDLPLRSCSYSWWPHCWQQPWSCTLSIFCCGWDREGMHLSEKRATPEILKFIGTFSPSTNQPSGKIK